MQKRSAVWIVGIWLAIALVNATQNVVGLRGEGVKRPLALFFLNTALGWMLWAAATPLVMRMALRFPPVRGAGWRTWTAHLGMVVAIGLAVAVWGNVLLAVLQPWGPSDDKRSFAAITLGRMVSQFHLNLIVYTGIVAVVHVLESRRRAAALTAQLSQAQLDGLRRQLEPHFLFNTLNAIAGLVREKRNDDAVVMIAGLSDLLRRVVAESGRQQVPLGEEMEFLERYLEIQRARFADRLRVNIDVPAELHAAQVPSLILQPLVENAIQHGIGRRVEGGEVRVAAARNGGALTIRIGNDGPPLAIGWQPGIGVSNSRERLANLYGDRSSLALENRNGGVEVTLTMPYFTAPR
jgi:two-component system LytT family sensor kinase